jgi:curved DNA-binding protein|tara:strand:+ start:694 stop:1521 length:828 start_codon:yes stop_codon:yes gene_type:complete
MATHYETLGVSEKATDKEIKKAYKKLAMQYHPDKGGDEKKFKEISAAYDGLKTTEKRQQYDAQRRFGNNIKFTHTNQPFGFNLDDIFTDFFGGQDPFRQRRRAPKNRDMTITVPISLENAYNGLKKQISVQLGSGKRQVVDLDFPAGVNNGMTLNYKELGDDSIQGIKPGNLQVRVQVNKNPMWERRSNDLYTFRQIDAFEAILGTIIIIKTMSSKTIKATIKAGTQPGTFIRIPNEGMPIIRSNQKGHLFVRIDVLIPSNFTQEQKDILAKYFT